MSQPPHKKVKQEVSINEQHTMAAARSALAAVSQRRPHSERQTAWDGCRALDVMLTRCTLACARAPRVQPAPAKSSAAMDTSSESSDSDSEPRQRKPAVASKRAATSSSSSDSDSSDDDAPAAVKKEPVVKLEPSAAAGSSSTALPPVRPPASAAVFTRAGAPTKDGKQLTKQQINQIAAREKRRLVEERKAKAAAALGVTVPTAAQLQSAADKKAHRERKQALKDQAEGKQPQEQVQADKSEKAPTDKTQEKKDQTEKKRKKPSSDSSGSDSDSDGSDDDAPSSKAVKASEASTPSAAAAAVKRVDTTGLSAKEAKLAVIEAKRAARALKKEKLRSQAEKAGTHPTQRELQLMNRDLQATKLWQMYQQDRKERDQELSPIELDEVLVGRCIAQIPNHEAPESHSFKLLYKHLRSMYGGNYSEQVLGGTIQPALSTKAERFAEKQVRASKKQEQDEDEAEEEEQEEVRQKQEHMDDPTIGAPYIVFISPSAIRAVEIGRGFKKIPMNTRVVKLFAKHLKVS
jgi:hypothetical protein